MKVVVAMDSFKGSMSSMIAGKAVETGIRRVDSNAQVCVCPLADGGEGTVEALLQGMGGKFVSCMVTGPLGKPVNCEYGILKDQKTAIIEIAGAAGGLGFAFQTFLKGTLESGVKIILEETGVAELLQDADYVITGEGRLDGQTVQGKAPVGVAKLAKKYDKPVLAFSGSVAEGAEICNQEGIDAFFPIVRSAVNPEEAMKEENAVRNMADAVEQVFRLIMNLSKSGGKRS